MSVKRQKRLIVDNMSKYDVCYSIFNFFLKMYTLCKGSNLRKNSRNLESWVIIGPLWVKYGGKTAYQSLTAQNPRNAPS